MLFKAQTHDLQIPFLMYQQMFNHRGTVRHALDTNIIKLFQTNFSCLYLTPNRLLDWMIKIHDSRLIFSTPEMAKVI